MIVQSDAITLLGKKSATALGLLRVGPCVNQVGHIPDSKESIISRYKDLFTDVGLLKDHEVHLHVDGNVKSVAQPMK